MINYVIFIIGCSIISYLSYRQVKSIMYNTLLQRKMDGKSVTGFPKVDEFEDQIKNMTQMIIDNYEELKQRKKKKQNKDDNMFQ